MDWISVEDRLPEEEKTMNSLWFDVWDAGCKRREVDIKFANGKFIRQCEDYQGDYSHDEIMENVTHWMELPEPPNQTT